ncbi:hypothetical protein PG985_016142 [Apiospora marii]|uniref:uncharacterized protein n=1 Tax=Apiospora marii TaxID=335849 RepID=UPI003131A4C8
MPISPKSHVRARQTPLSNTNAAVLVLRPRRKTVTAEGLEIEVPRTYHSLVVHVKYRCGHQPQNQNKGGIPATIKLRGDDDPHAGPCLPFVRCLRGCYVTEMDHELGRQCPGCEMVDLVTEGLDVRF